MGCMETNIYGIVQSRLYFKPLWLKIGSVRQITVEASRIDFRKKSVWNVFWHTLEDSNM